MSEPPAGPDGTLEMAMPRANGELVFAEPWERRVFGVTAALCEAGYLDWPTFQAALIVAIGSEEVVPAPGDRPGYYSSWLSALETLLVELHVLDADLIRTRVGEVVGRPHGHDHRAPEAASAPTRRR